MLTKPESFCQFMAFFPVWEKRTVVFFPQELGYEISEEELGNEILAHQAGGAGEQTAPQIAPEEFEEVYQWFLS